MDPVRREDRAPRCGRYSDAELAVIDDFLTRMAAVTRDEANALRDTPDREAGDAVRLRGPDRRAGAAPVCCSSPAPTSS